MSIPTIPTTIERWPGQSEREGPSASLEADLDFISDAHPPRLALTFWSGGDERCSQWHWSIPVADMLDMLVQGGGENLLHAAIQRKRDKKIEDRIRAALREEQSDGREPV